MQVTDIDCGFKIVLITWEKLACQWRDPWELPICDLLYGQDGIMTKLCQKNYTVNKEINVLFKF